MRVRHVSQEDRSEWLRLRCALWPGAEREHEQEIDLFFSGTSLEPLAVLVAEELGSLLGFAELSIRSHAEGCRTNDVGYLEGWYVDAGFRQQGVGRALVATAEEWAREQGCAEFASDTEVSNEISVKAHLALGFEEVETIRCFRKRLVRHDDLQP